MKTGESRIVGIRLGEVEIDLIHGFPATMNAKFALLRDDGAGTGVFIKKTDWSDKASIALQQLAEALEEDVFGEVFKGPPGSPDADSLDNDTTPSGPKQF